MRLTSTFSDVKGSQSSPRDGRAEYDDRFPTLVLLGRRGGRWRGALEQLALWMLAAHTLADQHVDAARLFSDVDVGVWNLGIVRDRLLGAYFSPVGETPVNADVPMRHVRGLFRATVYFHPGATAVPDAV